MPRRSPLRTGRAAPTASGSSKPWRLTGGQKCRTATDAEGPATAAVSVHEAWNGGFVRRAMVRFGADRVFAERQADGLKPLLPFIGVLWFVVGVQQESSAERAPTVLRSQ